VDTDDANVGRDPFGVPLEELVVIEEGGTFTLRAPTGEYYGNIMGISWNIIYYNNPQNSIVHSACTTHVQHTTCLS
jgi:hypothetical protein